MLGNKRVLALITARGGSKRLPGKNIKPLGGRPLIGWTIDFACDMPEIDRVLVSTDSAEIAETARAHGADVPWLRPAELASDTATSIDVIRHALGELGAEADMFDYLVLLQPTTPFRDSQMLRQALRYCDEAQGTPVVAFGAARTHPCWTFRKEANGRMVRYVELERDVTRSQDLPPAYEVSGSMYIIGVDRFLANPSLLTADTIGVFSQDRRYDVDIDDELDWFVAEAIAASFVGESCKRA